MPSTMFVRLGCVGTKLLAPFKVGVRIAEPNIASKNHSALSIVESVNALVRNKKHILATQAVER